MTISVSKNGSGPLRRRAPDRMPSCGRMRRPNWGFGFRRMSLRLRPWSVLALVLVLAAAAASQARGGGEKSASAKKGGVLAKNGGILKIGRAEVIDSLNPFVGLSVASHITWEMSYPKLVQYEPATLKVVPDLAKSWRTSPDGRTWTFQTHPDAKWSDGEPLTAADAAWTYNTIVKFAATYTGVEAALVTDLKRASAPTPTTLVLQYSRPVANVLDDLQQIPILPEHVWKSYATGKGAGLTSYPNTPTSGHPLVSGGPFVCASYVKNQVVVFRRNPNYYGTQPHIDGFGLQMFSSQDAEITALKSGEIDAITDVPVTAVGTLKAAGFHINVGPGMISRVFIFNSNPKKTNHRELLNPLVRKAFEYAVDRDTIIRTAWLGYGQPGTVTTPPVERKWHNFNLKPLPFNLAKANQLLDQAGYKMGPNGIRIANGHPMNYVVIFSTDQSGPGDRAFKIIQGDFAKIGVQLSQKNLDPTAANTAIMNPNGKYLTFDLAMWWWVPQIDPSFVLGESTTSQLGSWNDSGYSNPAYDKLFQQFTNTLNTAKRVQLAHQMQKIIYNARVYIVINYNDTIDAWSSKWTGFVETPLGFVSAFSTQGLTSVHLK